MIVLDASVALAWCFDDEQSPFADRVADMLRSDTATVPAIWSFEVGNALISAQRRGRLRPDERPRLLELLTALPIEVDQSTLRQVLGPVTAIADDLGLSVYDAAYVELAKRLGLPLATLDRRIAAGAERLVVALVT